MTLESQTPGPGALPGPKGPKERPLGNKPPLQKGGKLKGARRRIYAPKSGRG